MLGPSRRPGRDGGPFMHGRRGVNKRSVALIWAALTFIWGSTWLAIKVGLEDLPPFTFAGTRFLIAVVPLFLFVGAKGWRFPKARRDWLLLAVTGLLTFTAGYGLVFWGEQYVTSGLTAVIYTTYPLFGMLFAHAFLATEPLRFRKVAGVLLSIAGVAIIFGDQLRLEGGTGMAGSGAILLSAVLGALSAVLLKRFGNHIDAAVVSLVQMAVGGAPLVALGLIVEGNPFHAAWTLKAILCLLYLALAGTSLAFVLWYQLIQAIPVTRAQIMPVLNTIVAVLMGWLILGEHYGARGILGTATVLAGSVLALWRPAGRLAPAA